MPLDNPSETGNEGGNDWSDFKDWEVVLYPAGHTTH